MILKIFKISKSRILMTQTSEIAWHKLKHDTVNAINKQKTITRVSIF